MKSRMLLAGIAMTGVAALAACSTGEGVDLDGADGRVLTAAIAGEPDQLDPHKTTSYFSFQVLENIYDTLVEPDENLEMQPALAEDWELSDDQLTWTFELREGVTFHDGSEFTADDVVYSYNRIIDEELSNAWRLSAITDITATDDTTVEITVAQPTPNLLSSLGGFKGLAIVSEENATSGDISTAPIGTGAFSLENYTSGDSIELVANEDYWGGAPEIAGVTFRFISEGSTALAALKSGDVDWTDSIPAQQVQGLEGDDTIVLGQNPSNDYWYLAMNQAKEPWNDVRVRQAVAYAIDRDAIAQVTSYGTAEVNQLAIPKASSWYSEYDTYSTDVDQAKSLMADAGVPSAEMELLVSSDYPESVAAAQVIADNLAEIGITVSISSPDFASWLDAQNAGRFDMLMMSWLGNIDPDDFYYAQHHSAGGSNAQGYANPEVDALLDEARTETDTDARKALYDEAAALIADDASYIYLYNPSVIQAWSPDLEDYEARGDRAIRFKSVSFSD
ncbi:ABC transporter substrate-binding protein [Salinibacterium sp. GXW1014]|uniref:ABC transporter substrate-binding protein n=1 Tax=Salinibacterium sp. GXW1014 TaxID=3377838 RepID=UPI00383B7CFA